jgi:hypothetical protein
MYGSVRGAVSNGCPYRDQQGGECDFSSLKQKRWAWSGSKCLFRASLFGI